MGDNQKEENFENAIKYIKSLLTYEHEGLSLRLHYVKEADLDEACSKTNKDIYIVNSGFFDTDNYGKEASLPHIPLHEYQNTVILFGNEKECIINGNRILYADFIASAFFILSRYEEYIRPELRDEYGNFPARESVLYKYGILDKPLIDCYSSIILDLFNELDGTALKIVPGFNKIYFTHDIDIPFEKYSFIHMVKMIGKTFLTKHKLICSPFLNWLGLYWINPRETWNYMLKEEAKVKERSNSDIESICFIVALKQPDKYSMAYIEDKKTGKYLNQMIAGGAELGLHTSYEGAEIKEQMEFEKEVLEETINHRVFYQRNHYLRQMNPMDMARYEQVGFSDDFTTGYNETPGFRLGTSRSVKWIDPKEGNVHNIVLHGLQIMDGSLSGAKPYQLGLDFEEAKEYCKRIIDQVYRYNGDLCLLWHNGMFTKMKDNYQKELYDWVIGYCLELSSKEL